MVEPLAPLLISTWADQVAAGFILGDPNAPIETRLAPDDATGVTFRFRWLPHREIRTDTVALERRGILNPDRDEVELFCDPRDPSGRHCFLCPSNVRVCHPAETLVPLYAGDRDWLAGANFAWLARNHFTVMTAEHTDQRFDESVLSAMLEIWEQTEGQFRLVFNGAHAGATIPWHLHLHATTDAFPVEGILPDREGDYPTPLRLFSRSQIADVSHCVYTWEKRDPEHHRVNVLVAPRDGLPAVFLFLRDTRAAVAGVKGLMGGWEVAGDFAYSDRRHRFEAADLGTVRSAFAEIRPPVLSPKNGKT